MKAPGWLMLRMDRAIRAAEKRAPDFEIAPVGKVTMQRWHVCKSKMFNIYLHKTVYHDDRRALHDHPWASVSIIAKGEYFEVMPELKGDGTPYRNGDPVWWHRRTAGDIVFRSARQAHALCLPGGESPLPCWSIFITGPSLRRWGFYCGQGWVDEKVYRRRVGNRSEVGQGCA